jgi:hypothetical protein
MSSLHKAPNNNKLLMCKLRNVTSILAGLIMIFFISFTFSLSKLVISASAASSFYLLPFSNPVNFDVCCV